MGALVATADIALHTVAANIAANVAAGGRRAPEPRRHPPETGLDLARRGLQSAAKKGGVPAVAGSTPRGATGAYDMFSPMKLLVLVVLIAAVWFGFKALSRVRRAKAAEPLEHDEHQNIDDSR